MTIRLTRDGAAVVGAPVFLVTHYKTVDERFPGGNATVPTNEIGEAMITFNIGDATDFAGWVGTQRPPAVVSASRQS